jgi:uncharacterized protein (TIGR02145 family)
MKSRICPCLADYRLVLAGIAFTMLAACGVSATDGDKGDIGPTGAAGTSCIVQETTQEGAAFEVVCGGKVVGYLYHGEDGAQGVQGEKGETGATGEQGVQGEKGETGATGEQGVQGEKGETGATGAQGEQGLQGIQGPQGTDGTSCSLDKNAEQTGFDVTCGGEEKGTLLHGTDGASCTMVSKGAYYDIVCGSSSSGRIAKAYCVGVAYDPAVVTCQLDGKLTGTFTDSRDSRPYQIVQIGTQVWMAENLNYVPETDQGAQQDDGSWCYGTSGGNLATEDLSNCETYGRLYNWNTAMNGSASSTNNPSGVQGVCPTGWHLPSDAEWTQLTEFVGGSAGTQLKANTLWISNTGTDVWDFSALPGGYYFGSFYSQGAYGRWWSATEYDALSAWYRYVFGSIADVGRSYLSKTYGFSVRCAKD